MPWREIAREDWPAFLRGFRDQHRAWLVSVSPADGEPPRFRPLQDVRYVTRDGGKIVVSVGRGERPTEIEVFSPRVLRIDEDLEGTHRGLLVEGAEGGTLMLRFWSPMPPEMVNGA